MKEAAQSPYLARFESFEVNLRSGELHKNGERIRLPEQSFQILSMLLERSGEVVLRQVSLEGTGRVERAVTCRTASTCRSNGCRAGGLRFSSDG